MLSANWLAAILGAVVGIALGLTGAGGGVIAAPALMRGLGFASPESCQVALLTVGTAALLRSIEGLRQGLVRYKSALWMTACGSIVTPVGVRLAAAVSPMLLTAAFAS